MTFPRLRTFAFAIALTGSATIAVQAQSNSQPAPLFHFGSAQIDCSSYLTPQNLTPTARIAGSVGSIQVLQFTPGDMIELATAQDVHPGMELRILRMDDAWGEFEQFAGQHRELRAMGHRVESIGKLRILTTQGTSALARVESVCSPVHTGDFGIPWTPRTVPTQLNVPAFSTAQIPSSAQFAGAGLVVAARDSAYEAGPNDEIYLNRGTAQGTHPGQVWLIVRGPDSPSQQWLRQVVTGLQAPAYTQSSGNDKMTKSASRIPHVIGQAVVLWAENSSSTVIVTDAGSTIYPGDQAIPLP